MAIRFNPFRPGKIAGPGMFAGRGAELLALHRILLQTRHRNAQHFVLSGERGIGKSSLLLFLKVIATGEVVVHEGETYRFLVIDCELTPTLTDRQLISQIASALRRGLAPYDKLKETLTACWSFLKRVEAAGVKIGEGRQITEVPELMDDLVAAFASALESLDGQVEGILLLIDEADKAPLEANLGAFLKLFTERLSKQQSDNICIGLAGVTGIVQKLRESHESAPRAFTVFDLDPLEVDERKSVVIQGLEHGNLKNDPKITITNEALDLIAGLSEGFPHFIQQFAYSAFESDTDGSISIEDVLGGAKMENGALDQLGQKYFQQMFFDKINVEEYREVLRAIAQKENTDGWVTKEQTRETSKLKETTLTNAIQALKARDIIVAKVGVKGVYRLPTRSFAAWIRARQLKEVGG